MTANLSPRWAKLVKRAYRRGVGKLHLATLEQVREYLESSDVFDRPNSTLHAPEPGVRFKVFEPNDQLVRPALIMVVGSAYIWTPNVRLEAWCDYLMRQLGFRVFLSLHRLAPEHKFPTAYEDTLRVVQWVHANAQSLCVDANSMAICGESSGAAMAAAVCHRLRDDGNPFLKHQVLVYPMTDAQNYPSKIVYDSGHLVEVAYLEWAASHYLNNWEERFDPRVSPLYHRQFTGLPETTMVFAQYDPLKDEGYAYAAHLEAAGVPIALKEFSGVSHAFISFAPHIPEATEANAFICQRLRQGLQPRLQLQRRDENTYCHA